MMNTKNIVLRNWRFLYCFLIVLFVESKLYAQIIYTDIIPDATPNASYSLDLNNDSIVDFLIQFGGSSGMIGVMCYPQNYNAYSGDFVGGIYSPWALSAADAICDSSATWYDSNYPGTMGLGASIGFWPGATDKYLALKLIAGTNTYYGWARFDFLAMSGSFTIKDYAYNSSPNDCIFAGQTITGFDELTNKNAFSIYPNPFISTTTIQTIGDFQNATVTIYDLLGKSLKQINNVSGMTVSLSRDDLPGGLYLLRLTEGNKIIAVEKLIIND